MKISKLSMCTLIASSVMSVAIAGSVKNCPVNIPGGTIAPNGQFVARIDKVSPGTDSVYYNLSCNLRIADQNKKEPVFVKAWTTRGGTVSVNGNGLNYSQAKLEKGDNRLQVQGANVSRNSNGTINASETFIVNLDDCTSVVVDNCEVRLAN